MCKFISTLITTTNKMSTGTTIRLPHLEAYPVHISLFQDVKNAGYLRQQLLAGNTEFEYAFLDAATVHLLPFFFPFCL